MHEVAKKKQSGQDYSVKNDQSDAIIGWAVFLYFICWILLVALFQMHTIHLKTLVVGLLIIAAILFAISTKKFVVKFMLNKYEYYFISLFVAPNLILVLLFSANAFYASFNPIKVHRLKVERHEESWPRNRRLIFDSQNEIATYRNVYITADNNLYSIKNARLSYYVGIRKGLFGYDQIVSEELKLD